MLPSFSFGIVHSLTSTSHRGSDVDFSSLLRLSLIHSDSLRRVVPAPVKALLKRRIPYADYRVEQLRRWAAQRLGGSIPWQSDYESPHDVVVGVLFDSSYYFAFHVAACRELRVRYRVIDLLADDWSRRVVDSGCQAFLVSMSTLRGVWRRVSEERLWVIAHDLRIPLSPTFEELFLWESKRRMRDWLVAHSVPHPATWVFLNQSEALEFVRHSNYPIVMKTDSGASSAGVFVIRNHRQAVRLVRKAFRGGISLRSADSREVEEGYVLFQEFIPHDHEWRIVRVGDWFMCRRKERRGDFASGSGEIGWANPLPGMLDFVEEVTNLGGFRSMALDLFENPREDARGPFLVNELQSLVGAIENEGNVNAATGRWRRDPATSSWAFESGFFYQNACANLRLVSLLQRIGVEGVHVALSASPAKS